jgi:RND family efflux transporter MFP subunit
MSRKTILLKITLPVIIIIFGVGVMAALVANRPTPKKETKEDPGALVRVLEVKKEDHKVTVKGTGTVQAAQEVTVIPQVSGRVTKIAPSFVAGGLFKKGGLLFEIEETDYLLALQRAEAARARAEYDLATIESQARVARTEWERLNGDAPGEPNPLVVYEPQLKKAMAELASAEAAIEQARLDLARTKVRAPFNCRVRSEDIDPGQYVRAGNSVAILAGTDVAEIDVPMSLDELHWVDIPRRVGEKGSQAAVSVNIGGSTYRWQGRVVRSLGEVDPKGRMMHVVVTVNDPYGLGRKDDDRPALAMGTFVDVYLEGNVLSDIVSIPRTAFRENSTVWTMDAENRLRIQEVAPLRIERKEVLISEGLNDGDVVVLTTLSGAADGMKLRPLEEKGE